MIVKGADKRDIKLERDLTLTDLIPEKRKKIFKLKSEIFAEENDKTRDDAVQDKHDSEF